MEGKARAIAAIGAAAGSARVAPRERSPVAASAMPISTRKKPATGLAKEVAAASGAAAHGRRRSSATRAASPTATPSAKVSLPLSRVAIIPAPNQRVARRARGP